MTALAIDVLEAGAKPDEINATFDGLREHIPGEDVDFVLVAVPALKGHEIADSLASALRVREVVASDASEPSDA